MKYVCGNFLIYKTIPIQIFVNFEHVQISHTDYRSSRDEIRQFLIPRHTIPILCYYCQPPNNPGQHLMDYIQYQHPALDKSAGSTEAGLCQAENDNLGREKGIIPYRMFQ